jgi:farnesyl-diphosphate farnesyltransferase
MSALVEAETGGTLETPSGKGRGDENFPVGSWLIRRDLRPHVHAFYRFARTADDIADNPKLGAADKIRRLDRMAAVLDGASGGEAPAAAAMRASLAATAIPADHCHDLLRAFRLDAEKLRYRDWDDLLFYCRYSAAPVGRQVLDLHRESRAAWPASDALCTALQVLNHLQDCALDYARLDRVYLPQEDLAAAGIGVAALAADRAGSGLRRVIDGMLDRTAALVDTAHGLPPRVAALGLRLECAVIVALAGRLLRRLRRGDPLAGLVGLGKSDFAAAFLGGVARGWRR